MRVSIAAVPRGQRAGKGRREDQKAKCKEIFASGKQNLVSDSRVFPSCGITPFASRRKSVRNPTRDSQDSFSWEVSVGNGL